MRAESLLRLELPGRFILAENHGAYFLSSRFCALLVLTLCPKVALLWYVIASCFLIDYASSCTRLTQDICIGPSTHYALVSQLTYVHSEFYISISSPLALFFL